MKGKVKFSWVLALVAFATVAICGLDVYDGDSGKELTFTKQAEAAGGVGATPARSVWACHCKAAWHF